MLSLLLANLIEDSMSNPLSHPLGYLLSRKLSRNSMAHEETTLSILEPTPRTPSAHSPYPKMPLSSCLRFKSCAVGLGYPRPPSSGAHIMLSVGVDSVLLDITRVWLMGQASFSTGFEDSRWCPVGGSYLSVAVAVTPKCLLWCVPPFRRHASAGAAKQRSRPGWPQHVLPRCPGDAGRAVKAAARALVHDGRLPQATLHRRQPRMPGERTHPATFSLVSFLLRLRTLIGRFSPCVFSPRVSEEEKRPAV
ncbi:hypothetical protein Z043_110375 [Scleropages formosus]|uniref:Uncharacterized protein n=1 Tax=Scleropages formosus TaxID=113540 RepID=A0A0P7V7A6_SCLFO|nr:hypothetical protein Z043_110375 [Scleropages formosus]